MENLMSTKLFARTEMPLIQTRLLMKLRSSMCIFYMDDVRHDMTWQIQKRVRGDAFVSMQYYCIGY